MLVTLQEDLRQARGQIEDLEEDNARLKTQKTQHEADLAASRNEIEQQSRELSSLRNLSTLSQQNFARERDDLLQREHEAKEEFEAAKQAMQDWETLAKEERSIRENITAKVLDLEEQIAQYQDTVEKMTAERDSESATVDGLQEALQQIQEGRQVFFECQADLG